MKRERGSMFTFPLRAGSPTNFLLLPTTPCRLTTSTSLSAFAGQYQAITSKPTPMPSRSWFTAAPAKPAPCGFKVNDDLQDTPSLECHDPDSREDLRLFTH